MENVGQSRAYRQSNYFDGIEYTKPVSFLTLESLILEVRVPSCDASAENGIVQ